MNATLTTSSDGYAALPAAPRAAAPSAPLRLTLLYLGTAIVLFLAMGLLGLTMRAHQAGVIPLDPPQFYAILTLHGVGMVTAALLGTMSALWHVVQPALRPDPAPMRLGYGITVAGVLCVAASVLLGGFAAGWTFLYPLPFHGWWPAWATALFLLGHLLVGLSFALFCVSLLVQAVRTYGGLYRALGLPVLWTPAPPHGAEETHARVATATHQAMTAASIPPPPVLIATVTAIQGLVTVASGMVIGVGLLGHLADPATGLDPLWAKNITYFFGHSIANLTIYLAAGMLYAIMPRYARREWPTTRAVVLAWLAVLLFVLPAAFHHLYMDFAQPEALDVAGEGITYAAVTGSLVVTIYGALLLVWRSGFRWTLGSLLLYAGFSGWLIGGIAAALDVLIPFNFHLHNTLWVVGHFHTYFLLGVILFLCGFLTHLLEEATGTQSPRRVRTLVLGFILSGGYGLVGIWLLGGLLGLPRRDAVQPEVGPTLSLIAVICVGILIVGLLILLWEWGHLALLWRRQRRDPGPFEELLPPLDARLLRRKGFHRVS